MPQLDPSVHVLIQALLAIITGLFLWWFKQSYETKSRLEDERHGTVKKSIDDVLAKISSICTQNIKDHDELFAAKNDIDKRLTSTETIHRIKGCDTVERSFR